MQVEKKLTFTGPKNEGIEGRDTITLEVCDGKPFVSVISYDGQSVLLEKEGIEFLIQAVEAIKKELNIKKTVMR